MDIFPYKVSANSYPAKCGIDIYQPHPEQTIVICHELPDNEGMSICNAFEDLVPQVVKHYNLDLHSLMWIEHWTSEATLNEPEHYSLVKFCINGQRVSAPKWQFLPTESLAALIAQ